MAFDRTSRPATKLQAARAALGWTQHKAIWALQQTARRDGVAVAEESSLRTMLSRWENGDPVGPLYTGLFCKMYRATEEELGLVSEGQTQSLQAPRVPPRLSAGTVEYFGNVFEQHLLADNLMGPNHLVDVVRPQTALLDQILNEAHGPIRRDLLILACRYNEFTGWLYQDAGEPRNAESFTDRAMDYAMEIGDSRETAYILMRKSNIASDLNQPGRGLGLTNAALRNQTKLSPQLRALVLAQRGRALALVGKADQCARTLDEAFRTVDSWDGEPDRLASYCNPSYVAMEAAACWDLLGKPNTAVSVFERHATGWPQSQQRDHGLFLARLASSYSGRSDKDRACTTGREAVEMVSRATSARALRELQRLRSRLGVWRKDPDAARLSSQIQTLLRPR